MYRVSAGGKAFWQLRVKAGNHEETTQSSGHSTQTMTWQELLFFSHEHYNGTVFKDLLYMARLSEVS